MTASDPRIPLHRSTLPNFRAKVDELGELYLDHPRWRDGLLLQLEQYEWLLAQAPVLLAEMRAKRQAAFDAARQAKP